jgi:hypothetical protein
LNGLTFNSTSGSKITGIGLAIAGEDNTGTDDKLLLVNYYDSAYEVNDTAAYTKMLYL